MHRRSYVKRIPFYYAYLSTFCHVAGTSAHAALFSTPRQTFATAPRHDPPFSPDEMTVGKRRRERKEVAAAMAEEEKRREERDRFFRAKRPYLNDVRTGGGRGSQKADIAREVA